MSKQTNEIEVKVTGEGQAKSKLGSLASFIKSKLVITFGDVQRMVVGATKALIDFAEEGVKLIKVSKSFDNIATSAGVNSGKLKKSLKDMSGGMMSTADLMLAYNKAMLLSNGVLAEDFPQLLKIAKTSADATGQSFEFMLDSLVLGVGRASPKIIDNTGLMISLNTANQEYADSVGKSIDKLTEEEQKRAILNKVLKEGGKLMEKVGATDDQLNNMQRLKTSFVELSDALKTKANPILQSIAGAFDRMFKGMSKYLGQQDILATSTNLQTGLLKDFKKINDDLLIQTVEQITLEKQSLEIERDRYKVGSSSRQNADAGIKKKQELIDKINKEIEARQKLEKDKIDKLSKEKKDREDKEKKEKEDLEAKKQGDKDYATWQAEIYQRQYDKTKELQQKRIDDEIELSDALGKITEDGGKAMGEYLKKQLMGQIDACMATEIGKAMMSAPMTLGASLGAIPLITAGGTAGKALINAVQFAQGGQFETRPQVMQTNAGQTAVTNEKGLEIHKVEAIGKTQSSSSVVPIVINLGGVELKRLAVNLKPYMNAIDRGVI